MTTSAATGYNLSRAFSQTKLDVMRTALASVVPPGAIAVTFGSYARREASDSSDLDYSLLLPDGDMSVGQDWQENVGAVLRSIVPLDPAINGPFAGSVTKSSVVTNLGGEADGNQNITRRMLLLLEGEWLANEEEFNLLRCDLLRKYASATPNDHQLALFLLNDVIRYWRTMTVDYAYKTSESAEPKPKAIRNIKLVFSRKLMYAGGLFAVGMTADCTLDAKIDVLDKLFRMPVVERLQTICGQGRMTAALKSYDVFLNALGDPRVRDHLKNLGANYQVDPTFRNLKNEAHRFTRELMSAFEDTFHATHPIRRAVLF